MNAKLDFIFKRRSIRKYAAKDIAESALKDILEAAMAAPSACAKDPWHFVVIRESAIRNRIADGLPTGQMLRHAPAGILVCGDIDKAHDHQESYMIQDCSAAIQNVLLAATALGLGACWTGVHPRADRVDHIRTALQLPPNIMPLAMISLGWPAEKPAARTRYAAAAVHANAW